MLDRFNGDVLPFGSSATGTERTIFGDVTQSDDINDNINTSYFRGWGIVGVNDVPTKQDFNAMAYTNSYLTSYLYQQGIPTWNTNQKYYLYSRCIGSDGKQYKAKTGTLATPNVGNDPVGDAINWEEDSSELDINSLTNKTTPVNTDNLVIQETGGLLKKLSWSNLKATLKTYFDTLYATTSQLFGVGQTWQDVTGSRRVGVTYTNTTGKPIEVIVSVCATNNGPAVLTISSLSVNWYMNGGRDSSRANAISFIVPNGATYKVSSAITGFTIYKWLELR